MENARYLADRALENFNSRWSFNHLCKNRELLAVTLSMGIATLASDGGLRGADFVKRADLAMYEAKRGEKNRSSGRAAPQIGRQNACVQQRKGFIYGHGFVSHPALAVL
ncbi:MAG: diguanylate cyclase [Desulfobacterales bacterium]